MSGVEKFVSDARSLLITHIEDNNLEEARKLLAGIDKFPKIKFAVLSGTIFFKTSSADMLNLLVDNGVDLTQTDESGSNIVHLNGHTEVIKRVVDLAPWIVRSEDNYGNLPYQYQNFIYQQKVLICDEISSRDNYKLNADFLKEKTQEHLFTQAEEAPPPPASPPQRQATGLLSFLRPIFIAPKTTNSTPGKS